ncbi:hypothetical protein A2313_00630 [Candidatus Roizmanbacteria bacterium RIFOXYB2_FULL_41_10]|uniref:Uncharacterized protein n=1 Tax=Candidatus Roizmanbacteria bacterium RIFOXYA1_FULL_41_12 TaxID=1802082 RepID=A0A1F7KAH2_9BACT|nr:MAG: hypothetical protein A2209_04090 [Candidatus Roizmanbacteria bacterium RIFOXYA1_FULL_41_12]OGK66621.1 MAG: hypothetical protein A2262_04580 [Candidatus Roizmanbacteria bacterium RIFOXYA2_FULL_41_8]OGK66885.1 MAG: hypothetical protein A2377_03235 [Candidatus Roizmanbacteria bacterium RIFOXYB1_FULL_41_27]OGK70741.1 MAG: hypothetical protein A2403_01470 [Candidatus Roizmanbacteria bacterium RIFOXYC1_FULL_41_16]OGK71466.1 MAG: hypothetical protein A2313_00630 [Candidatus Roizmanbacteria bac
MPAIREQLATIGSRNKRVNVRPPSPEVLGLIGDYPRLFDRESLFCAQTPVNFLGAMIVEVLKPELKQIISSAKYDLKQIHKLESPVRLLTDVSILLPSTNASLTVPYVLHKTGCGLNAGVVLTGNLAGVVINTHSVEEGKSRPLKVERIWNDEVLAKMSFSDPHFLTNLRLLNFFRNFNDSCRQDRTTLPFIEYLINDSYQLLKKTYRYTTQAFFALCQDILPREVSKQMSYSDFHFTRSRLY